VSSQETSERDSDDWDRHWDDYAASAAANPAQEYRRRLILDRLGSGDPPRRVLDVGSGTGDLAAGLLARFPEADVVGLELSRYAVELAEEKVPRATFLCRNLLEERAPESGYDGWATHAVCSEVLEHVDDPAQLLSNARAYMSEGCRLVVTVPGGPRSAFDRHLGHRRHFSPDDLQRLLEQAGFTPDSCAAAGFPFFNLYRLVVLLRGRRLIEDVGTSHGLSLSARLVMGAFRQLFRANVPRSRWGWQTVGVATVESGQRARQRPTRPSAARARRT
jgi:SAM-dependent methyltransferase